jgi:hypothetical protein
LRLGDEEDEWSGGGELAGSGRGLRYGGRRRLDEATEEADLDE